MLCLDIGNSHIHGCIFQDENSPDFISEFRIGTHDVQSFTKYLASEKSLISKAYISSVVNSAQNNVLNILQKFNIPSKALSYKDVSALDLSEFTNPEEIGMDLLVAAFAAHILFANEDIILIDLGTATTITALDKHGKFYGGAIMPGIKLQANSLNFHTDKLDYVEIKSNTKAISSNTHEAINAGIYIGHIGAMKEIISRAKHDINFHNAIVVATGGASALFSNELLFDKTHITLILQGLRLIMKKY